ncbi:hyaluronidase PH-20-like [Sorex araneus]|uniref:hyaluronidase PH-20-like n=1 Tax=Sorex araneus TaxID=42254 RepID=UPI0003315E08|nr:hyaluronidase PH-20-like [Sorex araneus]
MELLWIKDIFSRKFVGFSGVSKVEFIFHLFPILLTADYRAPPIISNTTYIPAWNAPSDVCAKLFNISLDLSFYPLKGNPQASAIGQTVTLFYVEKLGIYPHIVTSTGKHKHGGIPQLGNISEHLDKAEKDILKYLPKDELGLAVIDWEEWRPIWIRNWLDKIVYRNESINLVKRKNPLLSDKAAETQAKQEFEAAGKEFMLRTLELGQRLRPNNYWGFYLFPDCYNHNYGANRPYTGACSDLEKQRNNELSWLWKASTALFPSIYLNTKLKKSPKAALFSRNRVNEAIRLSRVRDQKNPLPVFVYIRLVFTDNTTEFLSEIDLVNTIGETYALGASGVIIWGSFNLTRRQERCSMLHDYMKKTFNPYLINLTLAAKICSQALCQDQGFCTRKFWNSTDYLHLNSENFVIKFESCDKFIVFGQPSVQDLIQLSNNFDCSCFGNVSCRKNENITSIKKIRVCISEEVCISALINPGRRVLPPRKYRTRLSP